MATELNTNSTETVLTLNLSAYNTINIQNWFSQIQAMFDAKRMTSQYTKYAYVVETLPCDVATEVIDVLEYMPEEKPYDTLKNAIIRCTGGSKQRRIYNLFNNLRLGDMKHSQLLRKMKAVLGIKVMCDTVLKQLRSDILHTHINFPT